MWRVLGHADFEKYWESVRKRRARAGKSAMPKEYVRTLFEKWLMNQKERPETAPLRVWVYPNVSSAEAKELEDDLLMQYRKGRMYPTSKFLKYVDIEKVNEVVKVKSLQTQLESVRQEMSRLEEEMLKNRMVITKAVSKMIEEGMFEEEGIYPPADVEKIERVSEKLIDDLKLVCPQGS